MRKEKRFVTRTLIAESRTDTLLRTCRKEAGAGVDGTHSHSTFLLEQELQCELNQSRVVQLVVHKSEARVI